MVIVSGRMIDYIINRMDNGYAVFLFQSDYDKDHPRFKAICAGKVPDVVPGVPIKVEFQVDSIDQIKQIDIGKIDKITKAVREQYQNRVEYTFINFHDEEYAKSILIKVKGISSKTANRILDAVDGDIGRLTDLWDDAAFWKGIRGAKRWLGELKDTVGAMLTKDDLIKKYSRYGIGYPQVDAMAAIYGMEAEEKLRKNPYSVLFHLDLDFQVADHLAKDLGHPYLSLDRIRAMVYQVLNDNEAAGNTTMVLPDFFAACAWLHRYSAWKDYVVSPYCILAVLSVMDNVYCEDGLIGYSKTLDKEVDIAMQLHRLMKVNTDMHTAEQYFDGIKANYNKEQLEFIRQFSKNSVTVLLGRGGTGKTHTICGAINLFRQTFPDKEIRLCAPTARAAGVLKEHSGHESSTIHILLELSPYNKEDCGKNEETPLAAGLIIVDEMSMVDTDLMFHLLKAVKSGAKLILSGDPDQLESVGCGAVLRDLVASNVIPKVKLKKIMRQSEGSPIVENCSRILSGNSEFLLDDTFCVRHCKTEEEAKAYLKSCYEGDIRKIQIISTTKKGTLGTTAINKEFENQEGNGTWLHGDCFQLGDKVVFTKNNYDTGYCNGDIGFVESKGLPLQVRKQGDEEVIEINREDGADMEHADVITVHKSQGSEYEKVYILLPETPLTLLTRNMVNTAISRARKEVVLITVGAALEIAASNKYKKYRKTRLKEKLENMGEELKCRKEKANRT